jgi:hypothetical protein
MANALDRTDPTFVDDLRASQSAVWKVAAWLQAHGHNVIVRRLSIRPNADAAAAFADAGDLEILHKVEVSARSTVFTNAADYPFARGVLVDAVHKWQRATPKPYAYVILNASQTVAAIVLASTFPTWTTATIYNSKTGRGSREVYYCPIDRVQFCSLGESDRRR